MIWKIYQNMKFVEDCKALQFDTDAVQQWGSENCVELNIQTIKLYFWNPSPRVHVLNTMTTMS
jgi:hypothetical protein